jgi:hypothetical protein
VQHGAARGAAGARQRGAKVPQNDGGLQGEGEVEEEEEEEGEGGRGEQ